MKDTQRFGFIDKSLSIPLCFWYRYFYYYSIFYRGRITLWM